MGWLVGAAGPEAGLEQLSYWEFIWWCKCLMIETGGIRQEVNLIKERFLLSGAADADRLFCKCGWS